jgi:hypothetical protein
MFNWSSTKWPVLTALGAVAAGVAVQASAGDCTTSVNDPACYHLKGSDTLFDIMTTAITNARAAGVPGAVNLFYDGTGSGNAENQMTYNAGTGTPVPGASIPLGVQSIGPMSRNFRPKFIDGGWGSFVAADGVSTGKVGHASWYPGVQNVIGLDAAVVVVKSTATAKNLNFATFVDNGTGTGVTRAKTNDPSLPTAFGNTSALNNVNSTVNYSNLLMVILGGVDGSGSLKACSDPKRVEALQDLAGALGVDHVEHLYRRDDNSGTTDTFKDRIITIGTLGTTSPGSDTRYPWVGGRFCNGQSIGGINSSTPQTGVCSVTRSNTSCKKDSDCPSGEVCQFNLNNQDFDPIRRSCIASDSTHAPTSCTDMTTGRPCQASDNNPNCTQGLIVALSDNDPGSDSITNSIAARVKNDAAGTTIGYAGREAVLPGKGTKGLSINTTSFSDTNVRKDAYLLSRRLFLQNSLAPGQPPADQPSDTAGPNINITGQGSSQLAAEQNLFAWMTDPAQFGRCNVDTIVKQFNFITCWTDCTVDVANLSGNLCQNTPAPAIPSPLSALLPNGALGGSNGSGGAKTINSQGLTWTGTALVGDTCTPGAQNVCIGGQACDPTGHCPAYAGRPSNAACVQNSDCTSGVCTDSLGLGLAPAALLCQ